MANKTFDPPNRHRLFLLVIFVTTFLFFTLVVASLARAQTHGVRFDLEQCTCGDLPLNAEQSFAMGIVLHCAYEWPVVTAGGASTSRAVFEVNFTQDSNLDKVPALMEEERELVAAWEEARRSNPCSTGLTILENTADHYSIVGSVPETFGIVDGAECNNPSPEQCSFGKGVILLHDRYRLESEIRTCVDPAEHEANVALLQQLETCAAAAAEAHHQAYQAALTPEPEPTVEGPTCQDWCLSLDPVGFWIPSDETPPNCTCDCGPDAVFFEQGCATCATLCQGEGQEVYQKPGGGCSCLCTDPSEKWDGKTGVCVPVEAEEQGETNRCEIELGENCQNSSDCGCSFTSPDAASYNQYLRCEPEHARADIFGCVFEGPDDEEMLAIVKEEYRKCTDAWLMMMLPNSLADSDFSQAQLNNVMGGLGGLDQVSNWQQKSGCLPSDNVGQSGGVVTGQEAADPLVCLMEYCRRVVGGAVRELEDRTGLGQQPVVWGPGIKVQPGTESSPEKHLEQIGLNAVRAYGGFDLYGDREATVETSYGIAAVHSRYLLQVDQTTGLKAYLFDGVMTYYYFHEGQIWSVNLDPGQMFSTDADGVPEVVVPFDPAVLEDWWSAAEYVLDCPVNAHQEGADCYCDSGFEAASDNAACVTSAEGSVAEVSPLSGDVPVGLPESPPTVGEPQSEPFIPPLLLISAGLLGCAAVGILIVIYQKMRQSGGTR